LQKIDLKNKHLTGERKIKMDEATLELWADAMQDAYRRSNNRENACILVLCKYPEIPTDIRHAMWEAIDAYVDAEESYDRNQK